MDLRIDDKTRVISRRETCARNYYRAVARTFAGYMFVDETLLEKLVEKYGESPETLEELLRIVMSTVDLSTAILLKILFKTFMLDAPRRTNIKEELRNAA